MAAEKDTGTEQPYPEHAKATQCQRECESISEFLEWLAGQGYTLATYHAHTKACAEMGDDGCGLSTDRLYDAYADPSGLLAQCFGINRGALELEKLAMLKAHKANSS